jgi:hypothetical protein
LARHGLERLLVDDPRDAVSTEQRAHAATCERCARGLQTLARARAEYVASRPAERFALAVKARAALPRSQSRWQQLRWPVAAAAAVALAAVLVTSVRGPSLWSAEPAAIRYKGAPAQFQVYVRHGAQTRPLRAGEALAAGDQLAFTYALSRAQHLLLFGIDDAGTIHRYFPEPALAPSTVLAPGGPRQLPVGIELDARRGRERLCALFSATPLDEARAREALQRSFSAARARGRGIADLDALPLPATQISVWFEKP